ncbi:endo alpha-1,4 polygalactosaminidase [Planomonospora sp. ID67723]|uniref:endo alpha-1,4 polygalactosaminidase n=1 Tax=Planomonospora sp. ID67723 TaxID=2738134 RepID=UPI0027DD7600|nr:endo alpha-1,4 polygalactosaminidase [Planomonospora sp. ID67723]
MTLAAFLGATTFLGAALSAGTAGAAAPVLPPANARADYQLGGGYTPPAGVKVVSRDRTERPASGLYNICYVNGFQTQPHEIGWWKRNHDDLLLKDARGAYVEDEDWGELMFDVRTPAKRAALAGIVGDWIAGCAARKYDAVEIDNLDTYSRSDGLIKQGHALAFAGLLTSAAHSRGLAIAQKNSAEIVREGRKAGFDFAVAEECGRYDECGAYVGEYGSNVIVVEYRRADFTRTCGKFGARLSVMLRDVPLRTAGKRGYVYDAC